MKLAVIVFGLMLLASPAHAVNQSAWLKRCEGGDCEIVQRLMDQATQTRILEVAIGFPTGPGAGRGVIILPLGVDISQPMTLQIDTGAPVPFSVRYCLRDGCYGFLDLPTSMLAAMKSGQMGVVAFRTFDGQPGRLPLALDGFTAALQSVTP